jgi:Uma2 family endonuclease
MSTAVAQRIYTPEDLLALPDSVSYELVDGELVERNMGFESSVVGGRLFRLLANHCHSNNLGDVAPADASYQCFPDAPNKVRKPDVSFIALGRLPAGVLPRGHCRIAPDLAAEVVSPNDAFSEVETKVSEYLAAGVRLVWVIDPPTRVVLVYRPDGSGARLSDGYELTGEDVVSGFRCLVGELFPSPPSAGA